MKSLLVVDGYNVIGAWKDVVKYGWSMDEARDRLLRELEDYSGYTGVEVVLVFDGYQSDRLQRSTETRGDVSLVFTKHGETADSFIERVAAHTPKYRELYVATSDGLEQSQILSTGAVRMTSRELLERLRSTRNRELSSHRSQNERKRNTLSERLPADTLEALENIRRGT